MAMAKSQWTRARCTREKVRTNFADLTEYQKREFAGRITQHPRNETGEEQVTESPASVREVIEMLRSTHASCEALLELQEFEFALNEVWSALATLSETNQEVATALEFSATKEMVERARTAAVASAQILAAFSQLCRAIRTWAILRSDGDSVHSSLITPPPIKRARLSN
jgi:methionyl-tRNA synthetase